MSLAGGDCHTFHGYFKIWKLAFVSAFCFIHLTHFATPVAIDNEVVGEPMIECGEKSLAFSLKTKRMFAGRIFAKGKTADSTCTRSDFAGQQTTTPSFDLTFGTCGMKGQRAEEPRGMYYSVVIVVSFHPMFVTKVDRAYHVQCFFEEGIRTITAGLDVSMISTADVTAARPSTGTCTYTIHHGTVSSGPSSIGPQISVAQVGDKIVHKWECTDDMYGILVRSCYVTDGFGTKAEVINQSGCPVDPILISAISYDASLNQAFAESHVFKFADRPGVWFYCQLQMCLKMSQACEGLTPPICGVMPPAIPSSTAGTNPQSNVSNPSASGPTGPPTDGLINDTPATESFTEPPESSESESEPTDIPATTFPGYSPNTSPPGITLAPAPHWSSVSLLPATETPISGTSRTVAMTKLSSPPSQEPPVYGSKDESRLDTKHFLRGERIDDDRMTATPVSAIYEEVDANGEDTGMEYEEMEHQNSTSGSGNSSINQRPKSPEAKNDRTATSSATARAKAHFKRAPPSFLADDQNDNHSTRVTRKSHSFRGRSQRDQGRRKYQGRGSVKQTQENPHANMEMDGNEDTFLYRDSELSNRLIIFDVGEEPPPDYLRWSHAKQGVEQDTATALEEPSNKKLVTAAGGSSRQATTTPIPDTCVVSAQGLIMILAASGALSILLVLLLVIVCIRYRAASSRRPNCICERRMPAHGTVQLPALTRVDETIERLRRTNAKANGRQRQQKWPLDADVDIPRLARPQERRKRR